MLIKLDILDNLSTPSTSSSLIRTPAEHEKIGQENADLERCLTILRAMMNNDNHIHLNLLSYNHSAQGQSREYEEQMAKLEQLLLHGRDLIQTFITIKLHKYSPNFCKTLVEVISKNLIKKLNEPEIDIISLGRPADYQINYKTVLCR